MHNCHTSALFIGCNKWHLPHLGINAETSIYLKKHRNRPWEVAEIIRFRIYALILSLVLALWKLSFWFCGCSDQVLMETSEDESEERLAVGMEFESIVALRECVEEFCVEDGFSNRKPINRENYLRAVCTSHVRCPFELRAYCSFATHTVSITKFVNHNTDIHVAHTDQRQRQPSLVSNDFLVRVARECVKYSGGETTSAMVKARALNDHGLTITYHAAWRALQSVHSGTVHHHKQIYQYIDSWLNLFAAANPGTVTDLERDEDNSFRRTCLIYGVFAEALQYCLPVIAVDACHLKRRDKVTLDVALTMTGRHNILIIGVAICNSAENGTDWSWFLSHLARGVPSILKLSDIVFISDRVKGIAPGVRQVFPAARQSHCAEHVKRVSRRYWLFLVGYGFTSGSALWDSHFKCGGGCKQQLRGCPQSARPDGPGGNHSKTNRENARSPPEI